MVLRKTHKRKALKILGFICFFIMVASITAIVWVIFRGDGLNNDQTDGQEVEQNSVVPDMKPEEPIEIVLPPRIDFQETIDNWVSGVGGNKSVMIYDLDRGELVGSYNPDEKYSTASVYKLFVVYEGYRRVQSGEWQGDAAAGTTGYTVKECLDLSIRRSYSPCAETLWGMIGRAELDRIVADEFGLVNSNISNLISTPRDVMAVMKLFYDHKSIKDQQLVDLMKDSFLNQPVTEYNWRQGLPSGFSRANVYNKVGWDYNGKSWNIYHDAAIVEFPDQDRHFIVVVMSNQVPFERIRDFGSRVESVFYSTIQG